VEGRVIGVVHGAREGGILGRVDGSRTVCTETFSKDNVTG